MLQSLAARVKPLPEPGERQAIELAQRRLMEATGEDAEGVRRLRELAMAHPVASRLLQSIYAASPFLTDLILGDPRFAAHCLASSPEEELQCLGDGLSENLAAATTEAEVKRLLRRVRAKAALLVALADLGGVWSIDEVTAALTRFADASVSAAVDWLLRDAHRSRKLARIDPDRPGQGSGYVVLAMGKHGAGELNYSSDIDLIVFFDPAAGALAEGVEPASFYVRLTKKLASLLQDVTEDGYAFRVDLRLRPDPRATQVAIAIEAAAVYYENMGQNWERAAMIKARPVAGDLFLGEEFLDRLKPYIWRKYLDYAAIADVQSLTRQIHQVKGHGTIAMHGHNLKLGSGGIRAIEFFVQTQQLIAGGRNPELRGRRTLDMLDALAEGTWISREAAEDLKQAYRFLRRIEHRLQMIADRQTHELPKSEEDFGRLARFAGYASAEEFACKLRTTFECVQKHSSALFEGSPALAADAGSLVFTGGEDDPETIGTLLRMGFKRPSEVSATIRGWHFGRYPATRSARAKERLTEIMPALLTALSKAADPDAGFIAFDRFLAGLPSGLQLFSLLKANPHLLDRVATILGTAPRLAEQLSRRPKVLDAVIEADQFASLPSRVEMDQAVATAIPGELPFEEVLDQARIFGKEQMFRIGVRLLSETMSAADAGIAYSRLAAALIARLLDAVEREMVRRHGRIEGGRAAVLGMGKLGGREMTAASDLDLILIYDSTPGVETSDGRRPLTVNQYYTRLTQRLIAALTAPTSEGSLYDVDMRLRPSGNKGPVATHIESFRAYHAGSAWTWEKLALTRARVVAGPDDLRRTIGEAIERALCAPRDAAHTRADILDMRARLLAEFGRGGPWNLKHVHGGLVDVEFIAQGLQVLNAAADPSVLDQNTQAALAKLALAGYLKPYQAQALDRAADLYLRLTQVIRLCLGKDLVPKEAPRDLQRLIASAAGTPDMATAEGLLADTEEEVRGLFAKILGTPLLPRIGVGEGARRADEGREA